jgi:hypothetical protein
MLEPSSINMKREKGDPHFVGGDNFQNLATKLAHFYGEAR